LIKLIPILHQRQRPDQRKHTRVIKLSHKHTKSNHSTPQAAAA